MTLQEEIDELATQAAAEFKAGEDAVAHLLTRRCFLAQQLEQQRVLYEYESDRISEHDGDRGRERWAFLMAEDERLRAEIRAVLRGER